jgi:zinc protease
MKKALLILTLVLTPLSVSAKPYLDIQTIKTPKGISFWMVQDKAVPVLSLKFAIKGGAQFDPVGKEGVGNMLTTLFDEGAGKRSSEEFQDALDSHSISVGFDIGRDAFYGSLKTTVKYQDVAFELFDDALNRPHFDPEAVERMRQAILSQLRQQQEEPGWIAQKTLYEKIFAGQNYARLVEGTPETVKVLTVDDLKKQKDMLFCKDHLKIGLTGDIDVKKASVLIDRLFGAWPACTTTVSDDVVVLKEPGTKTVVSWEGAQDVLLMVQPGLKRQDKDWWAARILDFSLGGGEFSSRLMDEVRVKRGLTYGVFSSIAPYNNGPLWIVQGGVDPTHVDEAVKVIKQIWGDVAKDGLKDSEIKEAQDYLIGSLPLALTSTDEITAILLQLQVDDLPKDTLDKREAEIHAVTSQDIKRVAGERLKADQLTTVIVGPVKEQSHEPTHPVKSVEAPAEPSRDLR